MEGGERAHPGDADGYAERETSATCADSPAVPFLRHVADEHADHLPKLRGETMAVKLDWPVAAETPITQRWGENPADYPKTGGHNGVDFGCVVGTPVRAAHGGRVIRADMDTTGYGLHVRVLHADGWGTIYAHLSALTARVGQTVTPGDELGKSGSTGWSTGPHLHFELRMNMLSVQSGADPLLYLGEAPEVIANGVTLVDGLRVRDAPGVQGGVRRYLPAGTRLDIVEVKGDWLRILDAGQAWVCAKLGGETFVRLDGQDVDEGEKLRRLWRAHPELH